MITHPLPIGTRVYYEDLSGGNGTITHNDNTSPEFAAIVQEFNDDMAPDAVLSPGDVDYVIEFDDLSGPTPVQQDGILRVL